jgi:hypothetical protein
MTTCTGGWRFLCDDFGCNLIYSNLNTLRVLSGFGGHEKKECNPPQHTGRDTNDWIIIFEKIKN